MGLKICGCKGRPTDGGQSPYFRAFLMVAALMALCRYLTNPDTQIVLIRNMFIFSNLHIHGFPKTPPPFFIFQELNLNIYKNESL